MSNHLSPSVAHAWMVCAGCGDRRLTHARKVGGQFPLPMCNRCTRTYRRVLREHRVLGIMAAQHPRHWHSGTATP